MFINSSINVIDPIKLKKNKIDAHAYFGSKQHFFSVDHGIINVISVKGKFTAKTAKLWVLKINGSCTETNPSNETKILFKSHVNFVLFSFLYAVFSILPICHKKGLRRPTTM